MKSSYSPVLIFLSSLFAICCASYYFFLSPQQIPMFYGLNLKEQHLVQKEFVFILPAISLFLAFLERIIYTIAPRYIEEEDTVVLQLLSYSIFFFLAINAALFIRIFFLTL